MTAVVPAPAAQQPAQPVPAARKPRRRLPAARPAVAGRLLPAPILTSVSASVQQGDYDDGFKLDLALAPTTPPR